MANTFLNLQKGLTTLKLTQSSRKMVKFQVFRPKQVYELAHPYVNIKIFGFFAYFGSLYHN